MKRQTPPAAPTVEENALAVMTESERLTKSIQYTLNALKIETDETTRSQLANQAWAHVDAMSRQVEESAFLIGIANDQRLMMEEQRNTAVRALKEAIKFAENNLQSQVQRDMKEGVERIIIELCGYDPESDFDHYVAQFFATLFVTGYGTQFLHGNAMPALGDWMREMVREAQASNGR